MPKCRMKNDSSHCNWRIYNLLKTLKTPLKSLMRNKTKEIRRNFHKHSRFLIKKEEKNI